MVRTKVRLGKPQGNPVALRASGLGEKMDERLPPGVNFQNEGAVWNRRWGEGHTSLDPLDPQHQAIPGPVTDPKWFLDDEPLHLVRRFLQPTLGQTERLKRPEMTVLNFIETIFLPEHVNSKRMSGRSYYRAILKHIITPEQMDRMFRIDVGTSRVRLRSIPEWPYLDSVLLSEVSPIHVERLVSAGLKRGYSIQTITHMRQVVSAMFSYAKNVKHFDVENPALTIGIPVMVRKDAPTLTLAQTKKLLSLMKYPEREMALMALLVNMNIAEICGLQWKHVNLTGRPVTLNGKVIPPLSIGVREQWYRFHLDHVGRSREREIRIPELLLPMLIELSCRNHYTGPEDFVLVSRSGTPVCQTNIALRRLKPLGKIINIPGLTWSVFRRAHLVLVKEFGEDFQYRIGMPASYQASSDDI